MILNIIMPLFRDILMRLSTSLVFFILIHEHRDHYERVYGQLQRLEANSNDAFWMSNQEEVFAVKKINRINRI